MNLLSHRSWDSWCSGQNPGAGWGSCCWLDLRMRLSVKWIDGFSSRSGGKIKKRKQKPTTTKKPTKSGLCNSMLILRKPQLRRWAWGLISLALQYQLMFPSCRRQEREASSQGPKKFAPACPFSVKNSNTKEKQWSGKQTSSCWDPIHPKTDWNDSDINFTIPELAGIFIQAQYTRESWLTLPWPEDVGGKRDSWELSSQHPCASSQLHQCEFHWCHLRNCKQLSKVFKVPTTSLWEKQKTTSSNKERERDTGDKECEFRNVVAEQWGAGRSSWLVRTQPSWAASQQDEEQQEQWAKHCNGNKHLFLGSLHQTAAAAATFITAFIWEESSAAKQGAHRKLHVESELTPVTSQKIQLLNYFFQWFGIGVILHDIKSLETGYSWVNPSEQDMDDPQGDWGPQVVANFFWAAQANVSTMQVFHGGSWAILQTHTHVHETPWQKQWLFCMPNVSVAFRFTSEFILKSRMKKKKKLSKCLNLGHYFWIPM